MATLERLRNGSEVKSTGFMSAMPSRAKYYTNDETTEYEPVFKGGKPTRYSSYKNHGDTSISDFEDVNIENEELKRDIKAGNPNLLPSSTTLQMLRNGQAPARPFENTPVSFKINSKGKLLLSLYAVLVLSLILVIILNAIAIERNKTENLVMSNEIAAVSETLLSLSAQNESISQAQYIKTQAENLGMTKVDTTVVKIKMPDSVTKPVHSPVTNWFDWLCDIFG